MKNISNHKKDVLEEIVETYKRKFKTTARKRKGGVKMKEILKMYLDSIENLLVSILLELKKQSNDDVIKKGDKVIYDNKVYYYGSFEEDVHILCDRFMNALIGTPYGEKIIKAVGDKNE